MPLTIFVADDSPEYREFIRYLLASLSDTMIIVGEAGDGEEAPAVALREQPDVGITNLMMMPRRRLPADGLRQRRGCLREQAADQSMCEERRT